MKGERFASMLNTAIDTLTLAEKLVSSIPIAKDVFASVIVILTTIKDVRANQADYVKLGLSCADVCTALGRGLDGKSLDDLSNSVCEAIKQLMKAVAEIHMDIEKRRKQNMFSKVLHVKTNKEKMAAWNLNLGKILHVFNTELATSTHVIVSDTQAIVSKLDHTATRNHTMISEIHGRVVKGQDSQLTPASIPGASPPLPPRTFFGRDELIKEIVGLAENFTPVALIGTGGIGKTSIALTVLHHDRIKQRFGHDRWFIYCDKFTRSLTNFLRRLSNVIGAGVENPEDLTPLRECLSSREMVIVLDNAESILDPLGTDAQEIYAVVQELSQFKNIWICITSRISTTPQDYKHLEILPLSMGAACDTFYRIYDSGSRSNLVEVILEQLDFHPLSITLLATVAHQNRWNASRLSREWEQQRTSVLQTQHNDSLANTIELSLNSPMFKELGDDARELLGVVAFFPQGVDEENLDWLFSNIPNRTDIFDKFRILSLTYRNNEGFVTMLAPLRDYLSPKDLDPRLSPLLRAVKEHYFTRLSVTIDPEKPNFGETRWIMSEDINVEHLLDTFTTIDTDFNYDVWDACDNFMTHLYWHKERLTILKPKIEGLPDTHLFKPVCLHKLSQLFHSVGNMVECKRLLALTLELWRERGDHEWVACVLIELSETNREMGLLKEGIQQANEALEISKRLGDTAGQAGCLARLAYLLNDDEQLDAAEDAASLAIDLLPDDGQQFRVCESHRILGMIYQSKGKTEKAIRHLDIARGIASSFGWHVILFEVHHTMAGLFLDEDRFDDAHTHLEQVKSQVANSAYNLGRSMELQVELWHKQHRLEEARSEALRASDVFEKLGATAALERCRGRLQAIQMELNAPTASG